MIDGQEEIVELLAEYAYDPYRYTLACFPWGAGELGTSPGPRKWQTDILTTIGERLQNPETRFDPVKIAVASGHGIGKTALVAFITKWAMGSCPDAKVVITSNTQVQLATKTAPELAKWYRMSIDADLWTVKATSITAKDPASERTWRADLIPWNEAQPEAFAGLHNKERIIVLIFDEASGIADVIWDTAQGALTDENTIILWLAFGNPTLPTGRFAECFGSKAESWIRFQIDSRTVEGTNLEEIARWEQERGSDSDFFRVRVRGEFPIQGNAQFIGSTAVEQARQVYYPVESSLPKVLVCDPARFGADETVIGLRQGRKFRILESFHEKPIDFSGERVIHWIREENPDAIVIDETGLGAGVVDHVRSRGYNQRNGYLVHGFNGGASPIDGKMWFNKRAEVWGKMKEWLEAGASIPNDPELAADLMGITFDYSRLKGRNGTIILESKDEMKRRGLRSPDRGDTLAMSFAVNLAPYPLPKQPEERPFGYSVPRATEGNWMM